MLKSISGKTLFIISLVLGPLILNVANCSVIEFIYTFKFGHSVCAYSSIQPNTVAAPPVVVVAIKCSSEILDIIPSSFTIPSSPSISAYRAEPGFIFEKLLV